MDKDGLIFEAMKRLSGLKYFYRSTIEGCVKAIMHERSVVLTSEEQLDSVEQISKAFASLGMWADRA